MTHAATRLLAWNREADTPVLLAACDRLIADDRAGQAIRIWNKLAELHRIPYPVLAPDSGRSLTNGDFTMLPMSQGFDWRLPGVGGVATLLDERPAGLRISFSGRQPENCDVLNQFLPVVENSNYELQFLYRTAGIAPDTGLGWRITDLNGKNPCAGGEPGVGERARWQVPLQDHSLQQTRAPDAHLSARPWNYPHRRLHRSAQAAADAGWEWPE